MSQSLTSPVPRVRRARFAAVLLVVGGALAACGGGPGSEEDLVAALTRDDGFTEAQAQCIATQVFDEYGEDEEALGAISAASDITSLDAEDGVPGFSEFFDNAVKGCTI